MENPSLPVKVKQEDVDMEIKEGGNLILLETVKQEDVGIKIKEEDCFKVINKSHLIHGIEEESLLNKKPNNDGQLKIVRKRDMDQIRQTKMVQDMKDEQEVHVIWTKITGKEPDPLTLEPADEVKVESRTETDASPSFSQDDELFMCAKSCARFTSIEEYHEHLKTCSHLQNSTSYINNLLQKAESFYTSKLWNLKRHVRSGEKPYKSTQYDFAGSELGNLKERLKEHKRDHPYKCISCDYTTSKPSSLKRHMTLKDHLPFRTGKIPSTLTEPKYTAMRHLTLKEQINNAFKRKTLMK